MSGNEISRLAGSQIRVRCGHTEVLGSLHARDPRNAYITFFVDELRHLCVLTDKELQALSVDCTAVFDFDPEVSQYPAPPAVLDQGSVIAA